MPVDESIHEKLARVRKPHVHLSYSVYDPTGNRDARELAFVVGAMGDYSGNSPTQKFKPLADRKFINIDRQNFDKVMQQIGPGSSFRVPYTLDKSNPNQELPVQLKFNSMDDFKPGAIAAQIPVLKGLLDIREQLTSLLNKVERSTDLERLLEQLLKNTEEITQARKQLGLDGAGAGAGTNATADAATEKP